MAFRKHVFSEMHIAPLAMFRIIFGGMMLLSVLRFLLNGWVYEQYVLPEHHFKYFGFEWVNCPDETTLYLMFYGMALAALMVMIGAFYRLAIVAFFLLFTYIELIDVTYYLNHYYFVSLMAFVMIFLPANRAASVDNLFWPAQKRSLVPAWTINIIKFQLICVYFFAGVAKLNYDWMVEAMPLKIWLPPHANMPVIGGLLDETWVAYAFSWAGALFDLSVGFLLLYKRTRIYAFAALVFFHVLTWMLFPIGMFPFIMIGSTLIFFPSTVHQKVLNRFSSKPFDTDKSYAYKPFARKLLVGVFSVYVLLQLCFPFRYLLYPGSLFWTEQGYRYSWRVMLMEKQGGAFFYVSDPDQPGEVEVRNSDYLTPAQEKMMTTQPDLILQYAKIIRQEYQNRGIANPQVRAEIWVTLNGSGSRLYVDPFINLAALEDDFSHKSWILPFETVIDLDSLQKMKQAKTL